MKSEEQQRIFHLEYKRKSVYRRELEIRRKRSCYGLLLVFFPFLDDVGIFKTSRTKSSQL